MSLSTGVSVCVTLAHQREEAAQKPNPLLSPPPQSSTSLSVDWTPSLPDAG